MAFDTIIKGGKVIDGSGLPMRTADVGIKDGARHPTSVISPARSRRSTRTG